MKSELTKNDIYPALVLDLSPAKHSGVGQGSCGDAPFWSATTQQQLQAEVQLCTAAPIVDGRTHRTAARCRDLPAAGASGWHQPSGGGTSHSKAAALPGTSSPQLQSVRTARTEHMCVGYNPIECCMS
ncbi:hypothetical protein LSTR_LSTR008173 [Laodelphax striatellus]|uniref:Uncharacterized protein n=1 Tax=Laodelphax striatellus TaxID=195883 RepID=A0A482WJ26_LAOST|nr:hypothetical protein LSTR_LSTR008173 [Laodelphax striatellus]